MMSAMCDTILRALDGASQTCGSTLPWPWSSVSSKRIKRNPGVCNNSTTWALPASLSSGPISVVSKPGPIQNTTSAFSSIVAWDGFSENMCGEAVAGMTRSGLPKLPMTIFTSACTGLIEVTTLGGAASVGEGHSQDYSDQQCGHQRYRGIEKTRLEHCWLSSGGWGVDDCAPRYNITFGAERINVIT